MKIQLPPQVIFYIPTRAHHNGFIRMNVVSDATNTWKKFTPTEPSTATYTISKPLNPTHHNIGYLQIKQNYGVEEIKMKLLKSYNDIIIKNAAGEIIPVISFPQHTSIFGDHKLIRNIILNIDNVHSNAINTVENINTIQHVTAVIKQKKLIPQQKGIGDLNPFVAKQLFDLATIRKDMCPITAEEFSAGNTAVMPCGHLFMQMAIEESFKKEINKCPWCRQHGRPTYV